MLVNTACTLQRVFYFLSFSSGASEQLALSLNSKWNRSYSNWLLASTRSNHHLLVVCERSPLYSQFPAVIYKIPCTKCKSMHICIMGSLHRRLTKPNHWDNAPHNQLNSVHCTCEVKTPWSNQRNPFQQHSSLSTRQAPECKTPLSRSVAILVANMRLYGIPSNTLDYPNSSFYITASEACTNTTHMPEGVLLHKLEKTSCSTKHWKFWGLRVNTPSKYSEQFSGWEQPTRNYKFCVIGIPVWLLF